MIRAAEKEHAETTAETGFMTWTSDSNTTFEPLLGGYQQATTTPMLDWSQCRATERVPGTVSGAWVFKGTRAPVRALFENLEGGASVNGFLKWFPGVTHEQVVAVLEHAEHSLVET